MANGEQWDPGLLIDLYRTGTRANEALAGVYEEPITDADPSIPPASVIMLRSARRPFTYEEIEEADYGQFDGPTPGYDAIRLGCNLLIGGEPTYLAGDEHSPELFHLDREGRNEYSVLIMAERSPVIIPTGQYLVDGLRGSLSADRPPEDQWARPLTPTVGQQVLEFCQEVADRPEEFIDAEATDEHRSYWY